MDCLRLPVLEQFSDRLVHGFTTRRGGVSEGVYSSLNLGINRGDDPERVRENFRRLGAELNFDPQRIVLSQQTHSTNIRLATTADAGKGPFVPRDYTAVDGLVTREPELPLAINTADCVPLLFYDARQHICAASHAGWRGTADGIAQKTVEYLLGMGCHPQDIYVAIGPSAGPCCYEVDGETYAAFVNLRDEQGSVLRNCDCDCDEQGKEQCNCGCDCDEQGKEQCNCGCGGGKSDKALLDLWRANRIFLRSAGIPDANIGSADICTICHPDLFYSHRIQGDARGAMASVIMLR